MGSAVSTSEMLDFNGKCENYWKFKYHPDYKIAPLSDGPSVDWGVQAHSALEYYYRHIKNGVEHDVVVTDVINRLTMASFEAITKSDPAKSKMFADMAVRLKEYFDYYKSDIEDWEILEIEYKMEDGDLVGRIDLIIRYRRGPFMGCIAPVDHKFLYDFWNSKAYNTAPQPRNYIRLMRANYPNERIPHMIFNSVRFRMDAVDKFHRECVEPTRMEMQKFAKNHTRVAKRIVELKLLSREEVDEEVTYSFVKTTCQYCTLEKICTAQLNGADTTNLEKYEYKPNTYGYDNDED